MRVCSFLCSDSLLYTSFFFFLFYMVFIHVIVHVCIYTVIFAAGSKTAVLFTGLVPGVHRLVITATSALEQASYTYRVIVPVNSSTCTVHLINQGVTVNSSSATAEFGGYGAYNSFTCKLDGPPAFPCESES